ncbi:MAG: hypothetical protein CM15mP73_1650 [Hyphomicrobiales bacterium]|nr:MAG: hypothetical protein CM15mP73_1650 [Hyphomicrobiales bacterium]
MKQTGIIVANGVTAETESLLIGMYKVYGGELSKYSVSNLKNWQITCMGSTDACHAMEI